MRNKLKDLILNATCGLHALEQNLKFSSRALDYVHQNLYNNNVIKRNPQTQKDHLYIINTLQEKNIEAAKVRCISGTGMSAILTPVIYYFTDITYASIGLIPFIVLGSKSIFQIVTGNKFYNNLRKKYLVEDADTNIKQDSL